MTMPPSHVQTLHAPTKWNKTKVKTELHSATLAKEMEPVKVQDKINPTIGNSSWTGLVCSNVNDSEIQAFLVDYPWAISNKSLKSEIQGIMTI